MSRTKLALDVVQDLRTLADSLEALANAAVGIEPPDTSQPDTSQPDPPEQPAQHTGKAETKPDLPKLTLVELRAFVAERSTPDNRPKIKAILGKFGVAKLTELPEEHYDAMKREVEAL